MTSPCADNHDTNLNQSKWIQLLCIGLVAERHHLCNAKKGAEFACVHNRDTTDFMNRDKFLRNILRKTKASEPYEWDILDEMGNTLVEHIVEDDNQGPSKESGPHGWYCHPSLEGISKVSDKKTVYLSPVIHI